MITKDITTPWYPGDVDPVRVGVYERCLKHGYLFSYWNGKHWGSWAPSAQVAEINKSAPSREQYAPWRGLKEKK